MIRRIGEFSARHSTVVLGIWVLVALVLTLTAPSLSKVGVQDETSFLPSSSPSIQAEHVIEQLFPGDPSFSSAVVVLTAQHGLNVADQDYIIRLDQYLHSSALKGAGAVIESPATNPELSSMLLSKDHTTALVIVGMRAASFTIASSAVVTKIRNFIGRTAPKDLAHHLSGVAGLGADEASGITSSFGTVGVVAALLVMLILFWVYRRVFALLVPLATIAVGFGVAQGLIGILAAHGFKVASLAATFMIVIVFGAGTDYCLFIVSRYREQLSQGSDVPKAIGEAMGSVGPIVVASGATVILGFSSLAVARFGLYKTMGPGIGLAVAVTLFASLTFTPAMLSLLGTRVASSSRVDDRRPRASSRVDPWRRVGSLVTRRPVLVIIVPTLALAGCSAGLFVLHQSFNIVSELPSKSDARIGFDVLAQHFPAGELAPIEIAINGSGTAVDPGTLAQIDQLTEALRRLPGVAGVRSVTQPLGAPITPALLRGVGGLGAFDAGLSPAQVSALTAAANSPGGLRFTGTLLRADPSLASALAYFLGNNGRSTRLIVTLAGNPYGPRAIPVTRDIALTVADGLKSGPLSGAQTVVGGPSVAFGDIQVLASGDLIRIIVVVLALVFLVLVVLLRALIAPLYLIATVVLSYGAALGATAFVFAKVLNQGPLSFWVPTFLFVILVALGADYTVFVMGRIREARSSGLDVPQAAVEGLVASGPVISAAGLILAGTFLALLLTPLPTLREVGFAVGFGVLLDTFIVRPLLVPALTAVVGTRAFWPGERAKHRIYATWTKRRWAIVLGTVGAVAVAAIVIATEIAPPGHSGSVPVGSSMSRITPRPMVTIPNGVSSISDGGSAQTPGPVSNGTGSPTQAATGVDNPLPVQQQAAPAVTVLATPIAETMPGTTATSLPQMPPPPPPVDTTSPPPPTPACNPGALEGLLGSVPVVTALLCAVHVPDLLPPS